MKKKNRLNLLAIAAAATLSVGVLSCDDDDPTLKVSTNSVEFDSKGNGDGNVYITVENTGWTASIIEGADHFSLNQTSGEKSANLTISAKSENTSDQDYKATVRVNSSLGELSELIDITQKKPDTLPISVSPTTVSILGARGSTNTISIKTDGNWVLDGCPDWLNPSATSGSGNTSLTLTALSENWSDTERTAELTVKTNTSSATATVSQIGTLPPGLRVETSNMTIMSDGFACDLKFGPNAKGHREAFFTETEVMKMTDRDIYNELMTRTEYNTLEDYTFLQGWANPNTKLVYCVAAYGNETNDDGTHKYGPMTIVRLTTKSTTIYDDMYLTKSYNSSRWTVVASRQGNYGQRCDEFYYLAAEDDDAEEFYFWATRCTYAFLAHLYFKPNIQANRNWNYCNGPQTMNWTRTGNKFFCTTWGIDRDTKEFSAELSAPAYYDLTSSSTNEVKRIPSSSADWNKPRQRPSQAEIQKMRNSLQIYKISK